MKTERRSMAQFLAFHATTSIYSSAEIALLCSASDPGQIDEMIEGRRKVPLGMVKALAAALDCSERELMAMALRDWYGDEVSDQIAQCFRADASDIAEKAWIAALRDLHDGVVPELTTNRLRRLQLLSRFSG